MNKLFFCFMIISIYFLSGCWDRSEIEEIGFVSGIGLDPVEDFEKEVESLQRENKSKVDHLLKSTYQVAIPSNLIQENGGGQEEPFFNITTTGMTNFKMIRQIAARRSRVLSFEHIKVIIINEELLRHEHFLENLLDFYLRDHDMRRRTDIIISTGAAEEVLQDKLPLEDMPSISIKHIRENEARVPGMLGERTIGMVQRFVMGKNSFLLPRIVKREGKDLKIGGAAIFFGKNNQIIGWLGDEEVSGYKMIMGEFGDNIIEANYQDEMIVFDNSGMKTNIGYERKGEKDIFNVEIKAEGSLGEVWLEHININDMRVMEELERAFEAEIQSKVTTIIKKMQEEFAADIFEFNEKVRQKNYRYWKTVQDDWDGENGMFQNADITVNPKVKIRHYMLAE
ncbi:Ger(x)C family spore germination protein [Alkalihalobacillus sp. 1P02AB]|uniref:Ger(x)C family spore germination protein n=1 Tax=Alkalihalobacillus sp. 1P02AB TaxID=3132260 RepID=UPI0039A54B66